MEAATSTNHTNQGGQVRTLLLIRHAKSSWEVGLQTDFERPLNDRGKRDAPAMAERLKKRGIRIDAFVASPAKRARQTAELFAGVYEFDTAEIEFLSKLYHAGTDVFFEVAAALNDDHHTVAVFSHNPGISDFVNLLTREVRLDNMPTCSIFAVELHDSSWKNFRKGNKKFLFFDYPKNAQD